MRAPSGAARFILGKGASRCLVQGASGPRLFLSCFAHEQLEQMNNPVAIWELLPGLGFIPDPQIISDICLDQRDGKSCATDETGPQRTEH